MNRKDIKTILISHSDTSCNIMWDWIGRVVIETITNEWSPHSHPLLSSEDIEKFIKDLIPIAIEFIWIKSGNIRKDIENSVEIDKSELLRTKEHLSKAKFIYNFKHDDPEYKYKLSECLIIDLENNISYIH